MYILQKRWNTEMMEKKGVIIYIPLLIDFSAELNRKLQISDKILRDGQKSAPPAFLNKFWQEDQYDCHLQDIAESVCTVQ